MSNTVNIVTETGNIVLATIGETKIVEIVAPGPQGAKGDMASTAELATTGSNLFIGNQIISGSIILTNGITGSLLGTASFAATASYALNAGAGAGFPYSGSAIITGSLLVSGSGLIVSGGITGSLLGTSSYTETASYAPLYTLLTDYNNFTSSTNNFTQSINGFVTTTNAHTASINSYTQSIDGFVNATNAHTASINSYTQSIDGFATTINAHTASINSYTQSINGFATTINAHTQSILSWTGSVLLTSSFNSWTSSASSKLYGTASYAENYIETDPVYQSEKSTLAKLVGNTFSGKQYITETTDATSFSSTPSIYTDGGLRVTKNAYVSGTIYTNDLVVYGTSSVLNITSSQLNLGTNIITVNTLYPVPRFGGLAVIDSGSSFGGSGSFLYDSLQDEFIFVHKGDGTNVTSSHFLVGPETYNKLGDETYITANLLLKSQGNEHVTSSNISDTGTIVSINSNTQITGSLIVSQGITGSFSGSVFGYATDNDFNAHTASINSYTQSINSFVTATNAHTTSINSYTQSIDGFVTTINAHTQSILSWTGSVATTGSNTFIGTETINGSLIVTGSTNLTNTVGNTVLLSNADTLTITGSLIVTGSSIMTGSLNVISGVTASLEGTASWATNAVTASEVLVTNTTSGVGPYYLTFVDGTTVDRVIRVDSTTLLFNADTNVLTTTASFAQTASFALNASAGGISQGKVVAIVNGLSNLF